MCLRNFNISLCMKNIRNIKGTIIGFILCLLTIPTALLWPVIQLEAISDSLNVYYYVKTNLVDYNSLDHCELEIRWVSIIYIFSSLIISGIYYFFHYKRKLHVITLVPFLMIIFYLLQTPFFIFEVGTYYNCEIDGQTIMGAIISSPKISVLLVLLGIAYDFIEKKKG